MALCTWIFGVIQQKIKTYLKQVIQARSQKDHKINAVSQLDLDVLSQYKLIMYINCTSKTLGYYEKLKVKKNHEMTAASKLGPDAWLQHNVPQNNI